VLPTLFTVVNNTVEPESGLTMLNNIVDNCEQNNVGSKTLFNPVHDNIGTS
jgi:hypothetical protein